jgi:hypothetical protein
MITKGQFSCGFGGMGDRFDSSITPARLANISILIGIPLKLT